jgi:hypothetical protein
MWKRHPHSSISRSAALVIAVLAPLAACATPGTWGYSRAPVAERAAPTTWGHATLPAGEPAPAVAGFSKQAAPAAGPTVWGYAKLPASPAPEVAAKR